MKKDFINQLPDDVLSSILSPWRLSLRDCVKASSVSKRWRKICLSPSDITFSLHNMIITGESNDVQDTEDQHLCPAFKDRFIAGVNQIIKSYRGTNLLSFGLSFCLGRENASDVDEWISFAVRTGVRTFSLSFYCDEQCPTLPNEDVPHVLRSELFEASQSKCEFLTLYGCELGPDFAKHLRCLKYFSLSFANLAQYDLQMMFSGLPKLEKLVFFKCSLPEELSISPLHLLKHLKINYCRGVQEIRLSNVNLYILEVYLKQGVICNFFGAPNLTVLGWSATQMKIPYIFQGLPKFVPLLRNLLIRYSAKSDDCFPECMSVFSNVESIQWIFKEKSQLGTVKMIKILKAFPRLRKLDALMVNEKHLEGSEFVTDIDYKLGYLSKVRLRGFCGTLGQIIFVNYLVNHSTTMLEEFNIIEQWGVEEGAWENVIMKLRELCPEAWEKEIQILRTRF